MESVIATPSLLVLATLSGCANRNCGLAEMEIGSR
jgi:hypothetical protein